MGGGVLCGEEVCGMFAGIKGHFRTEFRSACSHVGEGGSPLSSFLSGPEN